MHNVTYNDSGTYHCTFHRTLLLELGDEHVTVEKEVELSVVAVGKVVYLSAVMEMNTLIQQCEVKRLLMC